MAGKIIKIAGLLILVAALMAPVASAKKSHGSSVALSSGAELNSVYSIGCKNGTVPGATGGDNNSYDYYGDPCATNTTIVVGPTPTVSGNPDGNACKGSRTKGDGVGNDDYDYYYGNICGS